MPAKLDLTNERYGRLLVLKETKKIKSQRYWKCICDCGTLKIIQQGHLRSGTTKSCGCLRDTFHITHGDTKNPLYIAYWNMLQRCYNPKSSNYKYWGGSGVIVCDLWKNKDTGYLEFKEWALSNGYSKGLSLDRIKGTKVYSPTTCRWTTFTIQARNTKKIINRKGQVVSSKYIGVSYYKGINKYVAEIVVNKKKIRLGAFKNSLEAAKIRDQYIINNKLKGFRLNGIL